jgi:hypothetical protein
MGSAASSPIATQSVSLVAKLEVVVRSLNRSYAATTFETWVGIRFSNPVSKLSPTMIKF